METNAAAQRAKQNEARRVSRLTPAELEKKRAVDRENQRHFRAKHQTRIKALEETVAELNVRLRAAEAQVAAYQAVSAQGNRLEPTTEITRFTNSQCEYEEALPLESAIETWNNTTMMGLPMPMPPPGFEGGPQPWSTTPVHIDSASMLGRVIIEATREWRTRALPGAGCYDEELREPLFPTIHSLMNPQNNESNHFAPRPRPLSSVVAAQTARTPLTTLPERMGFVFCLSHLIRWLVCQTKTSYYAMPPWLRPTRLQLAVPHPAWIDMIPWPEVRDRAIMYLDWGRFEELRALSGPGLRVNWPYSTASVLVEMPGQQDASLFHPAFEAHVRRLENWSASRDMVDAFPIYWLH